MNALNIEALEGDLEESESGLFIIVREEIQRLLQVSSQADERPQQKMMTHKKIKF